MLKINEVDCDTAPLELKTQSQNLFPELSKDELITKLLVLELQKIKKKDVEDINIGHRPERRTKTRSGSKSSMFINLGKVDKLSKGDLIKYVSKIGHIDKHIIENVQMQKRFSTFQMDKHNAKDIIRKFKRARMKGRRILVKYDN
jgi:ATP-dependent RNA helicase DeaD